MIVKYFNDGVWGYIDNVRQVGNKIIEPLELIKQYDEEVSSGMKFDIASCMDFEKHGFITAAEHPEDEKINVAVLPHGICQVNKVFIKSTEGISEEIKEEGYHSENLLDASMLIEDYPANVVMLYLNDHKEYDTVVLITNQKCYLLNDNGKTIERLA